LSISLARKARHLYALKLAVATFQDNTGFGPRPCQFFFLLSRCENDRQRSVEARPSSHCWPLLCAARRFGIGPETQADRRARPWPGSAKMAAPCCFFRTGSYAAGRGAAFDSLRRQQPRRRRERRPAASRHTTRARRKLVGPNEYDNERVSPRARGFDVSLFPYAYYMSSEFGFGSIQCMDRA